MVGQDKPFPARGIDRKAGNAEPVLSNVEGLVPAYNVFLLIEKWNKAGVAEGMAGKGRGLNAKKFAGWGSFFTLSRDV